MRRQSPPALANSSRSCEIVRARLSKGKTLEKGAQVLSWYMLDWLFRNLYIKRMMQVSMPDRSTPKPCLETKPAKFPFINRCRL